MQSPPTPLHVRRSYQARHAITTLSWDPHTPTLWSGGMGLWKPPSSLLPPSGTPWVSGTAPSLTSPSPSSSSPSLVSSWKAGGEGTGPVAALSVLSPGVLAASPAKVTLTSRTGRPLAEFRAESAQATCLLPLRGESQVLVGGTGSSLLLLDMGSCRVLKKYPVSSSVGGRGLSGLALGPHGSLLGARIGGEVALLDPASLKPLQVLNAHFGAVGDMAVVGEHLLATVGSVASRGGLRIEPCVKLFDLRTMGELDPIPFADGPAFVASTGSCVAAFSQLGVFEVHSVVGDYLGRTHGGQLALPSAMDYIVDVAPSPSGAYLAVADSSARVTFLSPAASPACPPVLGDGLVPDPEVNFYDSEDVGKPSQPPVLGPIGLPSPDNLNLGGVYTPLTDIDVVANPPLSTVQPGVGYSPALPPMPIPGAVRGSLRIVSGIGNATNTFGLKRNTMASHRLALHAQMVTTGFSSSGGVSASGALLGRSSSVPSHLAQMGGPSSASSSESAIPRMDAGTLGLPMGGGGSIPRSRSFGNGVYGAGSASMGAIPPHGRGGRGGGHRSRSNSRHRHHSRHHSNPLGPDSPEAGRSGLRGMIGPPKRYRLFVVPQKQVTATHFRIGDTYNKSEVYAALENGFTNCHVNGILQSLYALAPLRNVLMAHVCRAEWCMACELGFLFHNLGKAVGSSAQATNFARALGQNKVAANTSVLEPDDPDGSTPYPRLLAGFNRFILAQLRSELGSSDHASSVLDALFEVGQVAREACQACSRVDERETRVECIEFVVPQGGAGGPSFLDGLNASLERKLSARGWCDRCGDYKPVEKTSGVTSLSKVVVLNVGPKDPTEADYWSSPGVRVAPKLVMVEENGVIRAVEPGNESDGGVVVGEYELYSSVMYIHPMAAVQANEPGHCVAVVRTPASDEWHLLNDLIVTPVDEGDATTFHEEWKVPGALYYIRSGFDWGEEQSGVLGVAAAREEPPLDVSILPRVLPTPGPGTGKYVALDAEFVALSNDEKELDAYGETRILRHRRLALARVSALLEDQTVIVDDYIVAREPVVDHLTQFSGIQPGDLDPETSPYPLVTLKEAYLKIRWLVDAGYIFVGHGLKKDFRMINIVVPMEQIADTVDLFYLPKQRRLKLSFLSRHLLDETIQVNTHDSVEDARAALLLFQKYEELKESGGVKVAECLSRLYDQGRVTSDWS